MSELDFYKKMASEYFDIDEEKVTDEMIRDIQRILIPFIYLDATTK